MDLSLIEKYGNSLMFPGCATTDNPKDFVGAAICVSCTIYFKWGWKKNKREVICDFLDKYMSFFEDKIKWVFSDEEPGKGSKQEYKKTKPLKELYKKWGENILVCRQYKGGESFNDASPYSFFIGSYRKWQADLLEEHGDPGVDFIRFSVPLSFLAEHPGVFQRMVLESADSLEALHGFAGIRAELSPDRYAEEPTEAWLAQQWNGLVVGNDFASAEELSATTIKSVSWLTIIGQEILPKADYQWLRSELPPSWFALYEYDHGMVIQAGPAPETAPVADNPLPATYVLPNMIFKPYRIHDCTIHSNTKRRPLIVTDSARAAWLSRFDVPVEKLDQFKTNLLDLPRLKAKHVLMDVIEPRLRPLYK